jgi:hypothetical protein
MKFFMMLILYVGDVELDDVAHILNWMMLLTFWSNIQGERGGDEVMVKHYRHGDYRIVVTQN